MLFIKSFKEFLLMADWKVKFAGDLQLWSGQGIEARMSTRRFVFIKFSDRMQG